MLGKLLDTEIKVEERYRNKKITELEYNVQIANIKGLIFYELKKIYDN